MHATPQVLTTPGGIGHVGIVVDNTPTTRRNGTLGAEGGHASVTIRHAYGNVALALSTKAPNVFAGISGGLVPSAAVESGGRVPSAAVSVEGSSAEDANDEDQDRRRMQADGAQCAHGAPPFYTLC